MQDQRRFDVRAWLIWTAGFIAFPIAGIVAEAVAGRIDDAGSALVGGLAAGAVIGTGQWLVGRRVLGDPRVWIPATAVGMGVGLLAGAWVVGYGTSLGELALMGAVTGIPLGAAQALALRGRLANAWLWAVAMPPLWALGWTVTTAGGIDVDRQFAVFGEPTARSPSWPCPGCCWTGSAPPRACRHRPGVSRRSQAWPSSRLLS
jgi:hypothetical protein